MFYIIGNPTYDIIVKDKNKRQSIGGSVIYNSLLITNLDYRCRIIGKCEKKLKDIIQKYGIDTSYIYESKQTTQFKNIYYQGKCIQYAIKGEKIKSEDIPSETLNSQGLLITPVLDEVDLSIFLPYNIVKMVDICGFLRHVLKNKRVILKQKRKIAEQIRNYNIFKCNLKEAQFLSEQRKIYNICKFLIANNKNIGIITDGENGSYIFDKKNIVKINSFKTKQIDSTGAGDIYGSSFLIRFLECGNMIEAGLFASAAASFVVEDYGINNIPLRAKIEDRVAILKKTKKAVSYL
jgi:sugar/nucleoside kinase (ribokinase family)